jgi:hypothetical protein
MFVHSGVDTADCSGRWRAAVAFALAWHAFRTYWTVSYRPEKHYMRGPGPKCLAKHGHGATAH